VDVLSAAEARRLAVAAAGLGAPAGAARAAGGGAGRRAGRGAAAVSAVLRSLGAVQLDTISVLARSHVLVPYARLGAVGPEAVAEAYWAEPPVAFEYWAHAACVLPLESWPLFEVRRRYFRSRYGSARPDLAPVRAAVLAALAERGPLTASDLGGAKRGGEWWDWSDSKIAVEELLGFGDVVCTRRAGWRRVYDLASRAIPAALLGSAPSDDECRVALLAATGAAVGVGTAGDLADYLRCCSVADARRLAPEAGLVPVTVEGWGQPAWASPAWLAALASGAVPQRSRTTLLTPFDPLVWTRDRVERVFGMRHRLEAYTPAPLREHGYYAMPVLAGGRLVGRVDPARQGATLVARHVTFSGITGARAVPAGATVRAVAAALREAATWVGASAVAVERVTPPEAAAALAKEVVR
jgi:hypothetical protein